VGVPRRSNSAVRLERPASSAGSDSAPPFTSFVADRR
jgi:hypothetical protein